MEIEMGKDARGLQQHLATEFEIDEGRITQSLRALCVQAKQRDAVLAYFIEMALHHSMMIDAKERYFQDDVPASAINCPTKSTPKHHLPRNKGRVKRDAPSSAIGIRSR